MTKGFYNTETAAKKMGVGFRTLGRWLELGKIKSSKSVTMPGGRTLWFWTDADIARGRKVKAAQRRGPKPKAAKR
jgi:predicted site-specific integrase-resolvase